MSKKVLVTGSSVRSELLEPFVQLGWSVANPVHLLTEDELMHELSDADGYLLGGDEFASAVALSTASRLKIIAFLGMGYENYVDAQAARELGIAVTNTPGTLSDAVAELAIGHLLNSVRKIHFYAHEYELGRSGSEEKQRDLTALHHGIIGMGGIGTRTARILRNGFGARVSYFSRTRKQELEAEIGIEYRPLEDLASTVDTLTVLTPNTKETTGFINGKLLGLAKQGLVLVNTASPEIVDAGALNQAIESGQVSYAAFDNFYREDTADTKALRAKAPAKLMITGHIGSLTSDARDVMAMLAVKSIIGFLEQETELHRVV